MLRSVFCVAIIFSLLVLFLLGLSTLISGTVPPSESQVDSHLEN